jgi:predicted DNA-binding transcriptional regulator YafY
MSSAQRLERLLYVLPRASQPGGARIDDLARCLDVTPPTILADIEEATARVFYHPPASVDSFNLIVEDDVVRLYGSDFNRPVRLTEGEAMALGLGLRVLAAEADAQRRAELLALASRLEKELVTPKIELQPMLAMTSHEMRMSPAPAPALDVAFEEDDLRGVITEAIEERVLCDVVYLKAGGAEPAERTIAPVRLLYARGHWYVRAYEKDSSELRVYRVDRIMERRRRNEHHSFTDPSAAAPAFELNEAQKVRVRYSPAVARWVAERENAQCEADGTLVLTHDVADMNWLVRHVLQYGGEAVVEDERARGVVSQVLQKMA